MARNPPTDGQAEDLLSIGALARAAGMLPDTVRVWARRYGRPAALRLPSGHRRYSREQVTWLRRVAEAVARGRRPSEVVPLDDRALGALLAEDAGQGRPDAVTRDLLRFVREGRASQLAESLHSFWGQLGPRAWISECVTPLLQAIGRDWADGRLEVRHEHFLIEILEDLVRGFRTGLIRHAGAPVVVLATLPGEEHGLGLQFAALIARFAGASPRVLGTNLPVDQIAAAAFDLRARAVAISISIAHAGAAVDRALADLRGRLPAGCLLIAGGSGAHRARRGIRGVSYLDDLETFETWLRSKLRPRTPPRGPR